MASLAQPNLQELDSSSSPPNLFDGTTRLYICLTCPYAQRTWIARNYKGLDNIELVAISLSDKPKWYPEKIYTPGTVPSLEHNGKVIGESLDVLEYIDQNFGEPSLFPQESAKEELRKELWKFTNEFNGGFFKALKNKDADKAYAAQNLGPLSDHLENALSKFENEGPYFLGQISAVDFVYVPFVMRYHLLSLDLLDYDIFEGRPRLAKWFEAMNDLDAYKSTKQDPKVIASNMKKVLSYNRA